uniref:SCP domain-containing protein n=1 Tax=Ascaris lumbricoides TaxID=6252 RepID=A0A0M3HZT5_ASCLU
LLLEDDPERTPSSGSFLGTLYTGKHRVQQARHTLAEKEKTIVGRHGRSRGEKEKKLEQAVLKKETCFHATTNVWDRSESRNTLLRKDFDPYGSWNPGASGREKFWGVVKERDRAAQFSVTSVRNETRSIRGYGSPCVTALYNAWLAQRSAPSVKAVREAETMCLLAMRVSATVAGS